MSGELEAAENAAAEAFGRPVPHPRSSRSDVALQEVVDRAFGRRTQIEDVHVVADTVPSGADGTSAAVTEARDRLAKAYRKVSPGATQQNSQRYADAAVKAWTDSGVRQGWSEHQVVEALDRQGASILERGLSGRKVVRR